MRQGIPRSPSIEILVAILVLVVLSGPPATGMTTASVDIGMSTSEDVLVMNSDVSMTFTVTDGDTGDPVTGCNVTVHIQRASSDTNGDTGHTHGEPREVPDTVPVPGIDIDVTRDAKSGWNLHVITTEFEFAPWNASGEHVWGEGHAHLYIDDVKVGRLYTEWYHIGGLAMGTHAVHVTLNCNDHMDIAVDGELVEDTVTIVQEEDDTGHSHMAMPKCEVPNGVPTPRVQMEVMKDAKSGWNVHVETEEFRWAPENASTEPVMGEGHAHLYVDGNKLARLYGGWYHIGSMAEGEREVRVTLNANNHSDYAKDGVVIEDAVTITVLPGEGDSGHGEGTITLQAAEGRRAGTYVVSHHFTDAGDYMVEVHIVMGGSQEVSKTFEVEVLEGDPAPLTIAGVVLYVTLAVGAMILVQYAYARRRVRLLRQVSEQDDDGSVV